MCHPLTGCRFAVHQDDGPGRKPFDKRHKIAAVAMAAEAEAINGAVEGLHPRAAIKDDAIFLRMRRRK